MDKTFMICCVVLVTLFRGSMTQTAFANAGATVGSRPGGRDTSTAEAFASSSSGSSGAKPLSVPTSASPLLSRIPLAAAFPWAFLPAASYPAFPAYAHALASQYPFGVPVAVANAIYAPNNLLRGLNTNDGISNTDI